MGWRLAHSLSCPVAMLCSSAVYDSLKDVMIVYGGFDGSTLSSELFAYSVNGPQNCTVFIAKDTPVPGRAMHTAVKLANRMWVYGGLLEQTDLGSLWAFDLFSYRWTQFVASDLLGPGHLYGHACAIQPDLGSSGVLYLFGGIDFMTGELSSAVYEADLRLTLTATYVPWRERTPNGYRPAGLFGASALYSPSAKAIVLYGGLTQERKVSSFGGRTPRFAYRELSVSSRVYLLNASGWHIGTLASGSGAEAPRRYLHAATMIDPFMVVMGGRTHGPHDDDEGTACASADLALYDTLCDRWLNDSELALYLPFVSGAGRAVATQASVLQTVVGRAVNDSLRQVVVAGGWTGVALGDVAFLTLPPALFETRECPVVSADCGRHMTCEACAADARCGWSVEEAGLGAGKQGLDFVSLSRWMPGSARVKA